MADLAITANNVKPGTSTNRETLIAKEIVTAGQVIAKDPSDNKIGLADNNSPTAWKRDPIGIALNGGQIDQPVVVHKSGKYVCGGAVTAGSVWMLSATPGALAPPADIVTSGMDAVVMGVGVSTTEIFINIVDVGAGNTVP
jgi:hypothetical protein